MLVIQDPSTANINNLESLTTTNASHSINGEDHNINQIVDVSTNLSTSPVLTDLPVQDSSLANINSESVTTTNASHSISGEDRNIISQIADASINLSTSPVLTDLPITKEPDSQPLRVIESSSPADINNSKTTCEVTTTSSSHTSTLFDIVQTSSATSPYDLSTTNSGSTSFDIIQSSSPTNINNSETPCDLSTNSTSTSNNITKTPPLADTDMVMRDVTSSSGSQINKNLPAWLTLMIVYLHQVSDAPVWHNLVSRFIEFENSGPLHGVSFYWLLKGND